MGFKANISLAMLALRILSLLVLVASAVLLLTDSYKNSDGDKVTFKDIFAYRYVIGIAGVGALYEILQLPLAAYYAATEKRLISGTFLPELDFYADKLIALLLASAVGAGFAVSYELNKLLPSTFFVIAAFARAAGDDVAATSAEESAARIPGFLNRGFIACGPLAVGCVCMAIVSLLSSINRTNN